MHIVRHRPLTRGVTELMYVGDDEAVEKATATQSPLELLAGAAGLLVAISAKNKTVKAIGGAVAFEVAWRMFLNRAG
jgi:hypothetical protein